MQADYELSSGFLQNSFILIMILIICSYHKFSHIRITQRRTDMMIAFLWHYITHMLHVVCFRTIIMIARKQYSSPNDNLIQFMRCQSHQLSLTNKKSEIVNTLHVILTLNNVSTSSFGYPAVGVS